MTNLAWILRPRTKLGFYLHITCNSKCFVAWPGCITRRLWPCNHNSGVGSVVYGARHYLNGPCTVARVSSRIYLQIIGTVSAQTAPSVLLFADSQRYLFNYGEDLHRLMCDLGISLDAGRVFLTGNHWRHIGGLSYIQYQAQAFKPYDGIQIHGPVGTKEFVDSTFVFSRRHFVTHPSISCTDLHSTLCPPYNDNNLSVKPVVLSGGSKGESSSTLPDNTVCYICELADRPGKFSAKQTEELGVPMGDLRKQLLMGKAVTLEDGRTIHPHQVVEPARPGQAFAIIDCPTTAKMDSLLSNSDFTIHYSSSNNKLLDIIIHITPQKLYQSEPYQAWLKEFGLRTKHILLNETTPACRRELNLNNQLQSSLHSVYPKMFPAPNTKLTLQGERISMPANCFAAENEMVYNFWPLKKEGVGDKVSCEPSIYWRSSDDIKRMLFGIERTSGPARDSSTDTCVTGDSFEDFSVTFLGTGASKPSGLRNTPGIVVKISPTHSMLLDCGDGTFCQLQHHYGNSSDDVLASIGCVFISHKHVDHHMGLVSLMIQRQKVASQRKNPLVIIGPEKLWHWLNFYNERRNELNFRFLTFTDVKKGKAKHQLNGLVKSLDLRKLSVVPVVHCDDSHGIAITHASGWKLVYSGDCSPSGYLAREGADATLLIHEATFLREYGGEAAKRANHSTVDGAIQVARRMRARCTILTHFSQRYNLKKVVKTPLPPGVSLAFDHMTVTLRDLPSLHRVLPNLRRALFGNSSYGGKQQPPHDTISNGSTPRMKQTETKLSSVVPPAVKSAYPL